MRRLLDVLAVAGVIGLSVLVGERAARAPAASEAPAAPSGAAVFASDLGIYVANVDGTGLRRLTRDGYDADPVWSPDAKRIAFGRLVGWHAAVMVMNADGSGLKRIGGGQSPAWSPDGKRIAVYDQFGVVDASGTVVPGPSGFTIVAPDGTRAKHVAVGEVFGLSWSPDGKRIAFTVRKDDWVHLYRLETGKASRLARVRGGAHDVAWSPNGAQIAVDNGTAISLVDVATRRVSALASEGRHPLWSPDGRRLAFTRYDADRDVATLLTAARDGSGRRSVASNLADSTVGWSGDSRGLLVARPRPAAEGADIWWVADGGGAARRVTTAFPTGASFKAPQWGATTIPVASAAPPTSIALRPARVLSTQAVVLALAADGARAAFETRCDGGPVAVWDAAGHVERVATTGCDTENGRRELTLAGGRTAWISDNYSMITSYLELAAPGKKAAVIETADEKGYGERVGNLLGEGSLLVYNTWGTGGGYEPRDVTPTLWRVVGTEKTKVASGPDAVAAVDVDGGRIAVLRDDGRIVILDPRGTRLAAFALGTKGMQPEASTERWPVRLAGGLILALRGPTIEVRDASTGAVRHRWPTARSEGAITLEDAGGNLAVYKAGIALHLLRLSDGRDRMLEITDEEGPVHAELEAEGLYVSYNTAVGTKHGRIAFVPLRALAARFAAS